MMAIASGAIVAVCISYAGGQPESQSPAACGNADQSQPPDQSRRNPGPEAPESPDSSSDPESMFPHFSDTRYWLSGQANFIFQTHPPFPAAYNGPNSLHPHYEKALSRVLTLYTGARLNDTTEILVDVEEAGGSPQHRPGPCRQH
jgi:hypothetical protein